MELVVVLVAIFLGAGLRTHLAWWLAVPAVLFAGAEVAVVAMDVRNCLDIRRSVLRLLEQVLVCSDYRGHAAEIETALKRCQDPLEAYTLWAVAIFPAYIVSARLFAWYSLSAPWYLIVAAAMVGNGILTFLLVRLVCLPIARLRTRFPSVMLSVRDAHTWDGCKCTTCQATRNEEHAWQGCVCELCGETRDEEHDWAGCGCRRCDKVAPTGHQLVQCRCTACGHTIHTWQDGICRVCGVDRPKPPQVAAGEEAPPRVSASAGLVRCAKCGNNVSIEKEAFTCTRCGRCTCWACVANAHVERYGFGAGREAVMFCIRASGGRGQAPCPMCGKEAARKGP